MNNPIQHLKLLPLILLLGGCASMSGQQADEMTAHRHYIEARQAQTAANYELAIRHLKELETNFPQSPYTNNAPLELAFAYYKSKDYDAAIAAATQYLEQQPEPPNTAYAHYLKGMIYFNQTESNSSAGQSFDSDSARLAYQEFAELANNYPDSQYRSDAQKRMSYLRNKLAFSELEAAKQDMLVGNLDAARNRAKYISENYADTAAANEALSLLSAASPVSVTPVLADAVTKENVMNKSSANEAWLLQQNPGNYTIQIAGTSEKRWLEAFIENNKLQDDVAFYQRERKGKDWYSVLYGNYSDYSEANQAAQQLMSKLGIKDAWVRSFQHVQSSMTASSQ